MRAALPILPISPIGVSLILGFSLGFSFAESLPRWITVLTLALAVSLLIQRRPDAATTTKAPNNDFKSVDSSQSNNANPDCENDLYAQVPLPPPGERPDIAAALGETDAAADWEARFAAAGRPITTLEAATLADPETEARICEFLTKHPRGAVILRNARSLPAAAEAALARLAARPGGPLIVLTLKLGAQAIATLLSAPTTERTRKVAARLAEDGLPALARMLGACHVATRRGLAAHTPSASKTSSRSASDTTPTNEPREGEGSLRQQGDVRPGTSAPANPDPANAREEGLP